ncbi:recombination regulator RecX [Methylotenera sp.]|uniref:recombination regulator RecX n=1 Tax=Methylotenera sp. TaxID=2051956 RepID=UPI002734F414|nr:recombination regulator RecX [Methylotenera sp.]MDP3211957.1 recombination regulator RecX [Methylotenera sp.]
MTKTFVVKSLRQRALDYLAKREYSYVELGKKLKAYAEENDDIPALLDDFKARGWLSDQRFTEQIIHARKAKFGTAKIAHELREKGIADRLITDAVETLKATELDNATEVWRKKFKAYPQSREEWAKQARFLQSRGFGFELIKKILTVNDND